MTTTTLKQNIHNISTNWAKQINTELLKHYKQTLKDKISQIHNLKLTQEQINTHSKEAIKWSQNSFGKKITQQTRTQYNNLLTTFKQPITEMDTTEPQPHIPIPPTPNRFTALTPSSKRRRPDSTPSPQNTPNKKINKTRQSPKQNTNIKTSNPNPIPNPTPILNPTPTPTPTLTSTPTPTPTNIPKSNPNSNTRIPTPKSPNNTYNIDTQPESNHNITTEQYNIDTQTDSNPTTPTNLNNTNDTNDTETALDTFIELLDTVQTPSPPQTEPTRTQARTNLTKKFTPPHNNTEKPNYHTGGNNKHTWQLPPITHKTLLIGSSNLARITNTKTNPNTQIEAYGGAKISHITKIIKSYKHTQHPDNIIFQVGTNHRYDEGHVIHRQFPHLIAETKHKFPNTNIYIAQIPTTPELKCNSNKSYTNLTNLNTLLLEHPPQNTTIIPLPDTLLHSHISDPIHWTEDTANKLFKHWTHTLN